MPDRRATGSRTARAGRLRSTPAGRPGARNARRSRGRTVAVPRPRLTSRAAVLVLVLAVLMVSYASSLRAYFQQRHEIQQLQSSIAQSQTDISALEREKKRWHDPAYVVSQARARFACGFPGEIGYRVLGADGKPLDQQDSLSQPRTSGDGKPEWWQTTLSSIQTAGDPPKETPPATKITVPGHHHQ